MENFCKKLGTSSTAFEKFGLCFRHSQVTSPSAHENFKLRISFSLWRNVAVLMSNGLYSCWNLFWWIRRLDLIPAGWLVAAFVLTSGILWSGLPVLRCGLLRLRDATRLFEFEQFSDGQSVGILTTLILAASIRFFCEVLKNYVSSKSLADYLPQDRGTKLQWLHLKNFAKEIFGKYGVPIRLACCHTVETTTVNYPTSTGSLTLLPDPQPVEFVCVLLPSSPKIPVDDEYTFLQYLNNGDPARAGTLILSANTNVLLSHLSTTVYGKLSVFEDGTFTLLTAAFNDVKKNSSIWKLFLHSPLPAFRAHFAAKCDRTVNDSNKLEHSTSTYTIFKSVTGTDCLTFVFNGISSRKIRLLQRLHSLFMKFGSTSTREPDLLYFRVPKPSHTKGNQATFSQGSQGIMPDTKQDKCVQFYVSVPLGVDHKQPESSVDQLSRGDLYKERPVLIFMPFLVELQMKNVNHWVSGRLEMFGPSTLRIFYLHQPKGQMPATWKQKRFNPYFTSFTTDSSPESPKKRHHKLVIRDGQTQLSCHVRVCGTDRFNRLRRSLEEYLAAFKTSLSALNVSKPSGKSEAQGEQFNRA